jgi:hypothetical protein
MTLKEKAEKLFNQMYMVEDPMGNYPMCFDTAKQCALIAVDEKLETLNTIKFVIDCIDLRQDYLELKQEIEKL